MAVPWDLAAGCGCEEEGAPPASENKKQPRGTKRTWVLRPGKGKGKRECILERPRWTQLLEFTDHPPDGLEEDPCRRAKSTRNAILGLEIQRKTVSLQNGKRNGTTA